MPAISHAALRNIRPEVRSSARLEILSADRTVHWTNALDRLSRSHARYGGDGRAPAARLRAHATARPAALLVRTIARAWPGRTDTKLRAVYPVHRPRWPFPNQSERLEESSTVLSVVLQLDRAGKREFRRLRPAPKSAVKAGLRPKRTTADSARRRVSPALLALGQHAPLSWFCAMDRLVASLTPVFSELKRRRSGIRPKQSSSVWCQQLKPREGGVFLRSGARPTSPSP
jgi:hypothetical protein